MPYAAFNHSAEQYHGKYAAGLGREAWSAASVVLRCSPGPTSQARRIIRGDWKDRNEPHHLIYLQDVTFGNDARDDRSIEGI